MGLLASLEALTTTLRAMVADLDASVVTGEDTMALVRAFDAVARLGAAGRLLVTKQVLATGSWSDSGRHDSAGRWMSELSGLAPRDAERTLAQARSLDELPRVEEALRSGQLSEAQTTVVTEAASADPSAQDELLDAARDRSFGELRATARAVKHRARSAEDDEARATRQHEARTCSLSTDDDGMGVLVAKVTPVAFGALRAALEYATDQRFEEARAGGDRSPRARYRADALVDLLTGAQGGAPRRPRVLLRVDAAALRRGFVEPGEVCDLPGVGPVPLAAVRALLGEALLSVVLSDGEAVSAIANPRRRAKVALELALCWRDPQCVVPGCGATQGLEIDHFPVPVAHRGPTTLENTCRICRRHHHQRHRDGYVLSGGPGHWRWDPPPAFEDSLDAGIDPEAAGPGAPGAVASPTASPTSRAHPARSDDATPANPRRAPAKSGAPPPSLFG